MPTDWTHFEIALLRDKAKSGKHSLKTLAIEFNRPEKEVLLQLRRSGISLTALNPDAKKSREIIVGMERELGVKETALRLSIPEEKVKQIVLRYENDLNTYIQNLPIEKAQQMRKMAYAFAFAHGFNDFADDFASFCVMRLYQNQRSSLEYMLIDFKARYLANYRHPDFAEQMQTNTYWVETREPEAEQEISGIDYFEPIAQEDWASYFKKKVNENNLSRDEKIAFSLSVVYDMTHGQIADCFGLSEARILQFIKAAIAKVFPEG